jgi:hypothetical protein
LEGFPYCASRGNNFRVGILNTLFETHQPTRLSETSTPPILHRRNGSDLLLLLLVVTAAAAAAAADLDVDTGRNSSNNRHRTISRT